MAQQTVQAMQVEIAEHMVNHKDRICAVGELQVVAETGDECREGPCPSGRALARFRGTRISRLGWKSRDTGEWGWNAAVD